MSLFLAYTSLVVFNILSCRSPLMFNQDVRVLLTTDELADVVPMRGGSPVGAGWPGGEVSDLRFLGPEFESRSAVVW